MYPLSFRDFLRILSCCLCELKEFSCRMDCFTSFYGIVCFNNNLSSKTYGFVMEKITRNRAEGPDPQAL